MSRLYFAWCDFAPSAGKDYPRCLRCKGSGRMVTCIQQAGRNRPVERDYNDCYNCDGWGGCIPAATHKQSVCGKHI